MKFSIVSVLNDPAIDFSHFYQRMTRVMSSLTVSDYEIIIVNNFEQHHTVFQQDWPIEDNNLVFIDLSRKFALPNAIITGLAAAKGDYTFFISAEQAEAPEWLLDFLKIQNETQSDMVYAKYVQYKKNTFNRIVCYFSRQLMRIEPNMNTILSARLMTRRYLNALLSHKERELNLTGLCALTGFQQDAVLLNFDDDTSQLKPSLSQKINGLLHTTISFSNRPLILAFYASIVIVLSIACFIGYLVLRYFFVGKLLSGYTSLILSIWFFSGLIVFFIGVQGLYIAKIFSEIKQRPYTIIRQIYKQDKSR